MTDPPAASSKRRAIVFALVCALATIGFIASQSAEAILILVMYGALAVALLIFTSLAGMHAIRFLPITVPPLRWSLLIGMGIGLGILANLVLVLGAFGHLDRVVWVGVLLVIIFLGLLAVSRRDALARTDTPASAPEQNRARWLLTSLIPVVSVSLLVCVIPPGFIWEGEFGGYDVLEYHLQLPREYLQQGAIEYVPHNVYANFPANAEMLYLLCMILLGGPIDGLYTAQILNALLSFLCAFAAYVAGRECSPRAGIFSAVIAASVPWFPYLSGVAYVENGMLLFSFIGAACLLKADRCGAKRESPTGWLILAGLMTGFACGCKYTAVLLVAVPYAVTALLLSTTSTAQRLRAFAIFGIAALVAFAPWLIKNAAFTGNPVFPLANSIFQAYPQGWGPAESAHFIETHGPAPDQTGIAGRAQAIWTEILADPDQRFGLLIFVLAAWRLIRKRERFDLLLGLIFLLQLAGWAFATHLAARFAVPIIVPLTLLAGRVIDRDPTPKHRRAVVIVVILGVAFNTFMTLGHYVRHVYDENGKIPLEGAESFLLEGMGAGHEHLSVINMSLPEDARILMIGDAMAFYFQREVDYCVVFNRDPFVEAVRAASGPEDVMRWLQEKGYTHVLLNISEVDRLRKSRYGFPEEVQPELFVELVAAGLNPSASFTVTDATKPYAVLYEVPSDTP